MSLSYCSLRGKEGTVMRAPLLGREQKVQLVRQGDEWAHGRKVESGMMNVLSNTILLAPPTGNKQTVHHTH